ncbi:RICIN domain-containing protein [Streptomyces sp. NPDC001508]|uniref:RICIN domain-containing protein n=1 Tax=Streptomyces sp. NPDC001508 TaxID=3154656 RepID=UPI00331AA4C7
MQVDRDAYTFELHNRKSGKCLGIDGASTANGATAAQFTCDGSANQGWGYFQ